MPLKFTYNRLAKTLFHLLGSAEVARTLHHYAAVYLCLTSASPLHVFSLVTEFLARPPQPARSGHGRLSLLPRLGDCLRTPTP